MKNKIIILTILILSIVIISNIENVNKEINCKYFTQEIYNDNILKAQKYDVNIKPNAIIVPHNEVIMDMTASTLLSLSQYDYDTIILLSVNHKAKKNKILLSSADFITSLGCVQGNKKIKDIIKNSLGNDIIEDDEVVEDDHSASVIMPYIKTYMPNTKAVTMLFTSKVTINEVNRIAETLNNLSKTENILLIGSIDFSHYQSYIDTQKYDEETINLIEHFNIEELKIKDGKNLDSSESMSIILQYAKLKGINKINILEHRIVSNAPFSDDYGSYISMYI